MARLRSGLKFDIFSVFCDFIILILIILLIEGMEVHADDLGGGCCSMKQSIEDDMEVVKTSPYLRKDVKVFGFLFDIVKGTVTDVGDL